MNENKSSFYMGDEINGYGQQVYWIAEETEMPNVSQENVRLKKDFSKYQQKLTYSTSAVNDPGNMDPAMLKMMGAQTGVSQVVFSEDHNTAKDKTGNTITFTTGDGAVKTASLGFQTARNIPADQSYLKRTSGSTNRKQNNKNYVSREESKVTTGWNEIDGKWFYYDENGKMVTGKKKILGWDYSFNSDGSKSGTLPPLYKMDDFYFPIPEENSGYWEDGNLAANLMFFHQQYHGLIAAKQKEYVSKKAILGCTKGTKLTRLDSTKAEDVSYLADGSPVLGCTDCKVGQNIHSFEACRATQDERIGLPLTEKLSNGFHKCIPMVENEWKQDNDNTPRICHDNLYSYKYALKKDAILICKYKGIIGILEVPEDEIEGSVYVELSISPKGENFTTLCEGHDDILANGNYAVMETNDGMLTTYGGLTIAEKIKGIWVPINDFTQSQVNNWNNGVSPTVWRANYDTYRNRSAIAINKFASDNGLQFTQYQFDALMDFCWTNGNVINSQDSNGAYKYDFVNIMLESDFLTNPTTSQIDKFESAFGNLVSMDSIRTSGFWARRMSQLSVFWGESDSNGDYIRKDYGNTQQTKIAADAWLTSRGLNPTAR